jgi:hypothetical protein
MIHTQPSDPIFVKHVNELIAINNERFKTYSRAMLKTHDSNFKSLCAQNKERTVYFNMQLIRLLVQNNQVPETWETGEEGHHFALNPRWAIQPKSKGVDRKACFWWDSIALKAYRKVVKDLQHIPKEIKRILLQQQEILESDQRYSGLAL